MKTRINLILGIFVSASALAQGNGAGNGGGVHVCYDGKKVDEHGNRIIKSVEMYDLYEGRERYTAFKSAPPANLVTEADLLSYAYQNAKERSLNPERPAFAARLEAAVKLVESRMRTTDQVLDLVPDAHRLLHGEDCEYDQLANWDDRTGDLLVRKKYLNYIEKSSLDLSAFKTHEALYFLDRKYNGAKFSDDARESNAMLYLADRGTLSVRVDEFKRENGLIRVRPIWTQASCYDYIGRTHWKVSFDRLDESKLPRLTTVVREGLFGAGEKSRFNLEKRAKNSFWGGAIGEFILSPRLLGKINTKVLIQSTACDEIYETKADNRSETIRFTVEP